MNWLPWRSDWPKNWTTLMMNSLQRTMTGSVHALAEDDRRANCGDVIIYQLHAILWIIPVILTCQVSLPSHPTASWSPCRLTPLLTHTVTSWSLHRHAPLLTRPMASWSHWRHLVPLPTHPTPNLPRSQLVPLPIHPTPNLPPVHPTASPPRRRLGPPPTHPRLPGRSGSTIVVRILS